MKKREEAQTNNTNPTSNQEKMNEEEEGEKEEVGKEVVQGMMADDPDYEGMLSPSHTPSKNLQNLQNLQPRVGLKKLPTAKRTSGDKFLTFGNQNPKFDSVLPPVKKSRKQEE